MEKNVGFSSIDDYIGQFEPETQSILNELRKVIKEAAPEATEKISYQMPTFAYYGNLVHFAAYDKHIGFYPAPSGIEAFARELSAYVTSKGAVRFPVGKPLPFQLISRIVAFRVAENRKNELEKKMKHKK